MKLEKHPERLPDFKPLCRLSNRQFVALKFKHCAKIGEIQYFVDLARYLTLYFLASVATL